MWTLILDIFWHVMESLWGDDRSLDYKGFQVDICGIHQEEREQGNLQQQIRSKWADFSVDYVI